MINPLVIPIMPVLGVLTANLNELIRGEVVNLHPKLMIGIKTFNAAAAGFAFIWFALLVTAISISDQYSALTGALIIGLFLLGIAIYGIFKGAKFLSASTQVWIYRLALPLMALGSYLVVHFG
ncbi:hypothetical protein CXF83_15205 [Shewanella sp. Choline-02u-19]|uniref:hypothetical protein n=1 Tax=unclassified Shewanella TaxID=196818 RepID=UPI000C34F059|nr:MULTISPECIES: hypothetical protein [unclassified Shewanella]PKG57676.1 hypothetical protein CXF82_08370 [Shewanella sp. GutDb-MelDb]PKG72519.1 hypothetical protein CXF86_21525 [Shewanella sp. GutCb]PKH56531.1 hypothetical protein CXF84_13140 [Shewanella sp. Bg11-22]PKI27963.1 hypothetical protein CXF83_15205 [Shewanella sp. Choline-02u-19]